jgi:hypothetical protein
MFYASESFEQLPGQMDGWLLEDDHHLDRLPRKLTGFVLQARLGFAMRESGLEIDEY